MFKKDLRLNTIRLRNKLTSDSLTQLSIDITDRIKDLPIWSYNFYHIFLPISPKKEINTYYIIDSLKEKKKNIIVPKVEENTLNHFLFTEETKIKNNSWKVPEPVNGKQVFPNQIDVVFIPLLAFDKLGNRVGYGKGFYDDFLNQCKPETIKIGLSHFEACEKITDVYNGDVQMNYCVTPNQIYKF